MELSDTSKIVGPSPLRSQVIRNHDRKNECFLTTFWEKMVCFTKLTPRTPPSVIHGWKATDLLSQMVKRKNYLLNPISRQNFADALAENHNLKLEVCCRAIRSCREKKFKIAFFPDQPFMEQISYKYLLPSVSSNRYLAKFLLATFNWSSTYSSHPVPFLIKLLLVLL